MISIILMISLVIMGNYIKAQQEETEYVDNYIECNDYNIYDVNMDEKVNVLDVVHIVNEII